MKLAGFKNLWFRITLTGTLSLMTVYCTSNSGHNQASIPPLEGTGHSGGGSVEKSTPEQVNAALDLALKLASPESKYINDNIFVNFWSDNGRRSQYDFIKSPIHVFPNVGRYIDFSSPQIEALKHNKIVRQPLGDCPHPPSETTADASVSEFTTNATICISIGNLAHLPESALLQEILSLLIHEVSHMGGAEEAEAKIWQSEFKAYFGARFGDLETDSISMKFLETMAEAKGLIQRANGWASTNPKDSRIFGDLTEITRMLGDLPNLSDTLALTLKIHPTHPELIPQYRSSVLNLVVHTQEYLVTDTQTEGPQGPVHAPKQNPETIDLPTTIAMYRANLDQILSAYLAFSGIKSNPQYTCALNYLSNQDAAVSFSASGLDQTCQNQPSKN